jgi:hypothetical protein
MLQNFNIFDNDVSLNLYYVLPFVIKWVIIVSSDYSCYELTIRQMAVFLDAVKRYYSVVLCR